MGLFAIYTVTFNKTRQVDREESNFIYEENIANLMKKISFCFIFVILGVLI
jgi:hypothetical protein